jgi:hypothetical protein
MKVYVGIYEHRYGTDVRVFDHIDKVEGWRQSIAEEYFFNEFRGVEKPQTLEETTDYYWNNIENEWFNVENTEVE